MANEGNQNEAKALEIEKRILPSIEQPDLDNIKAHVEDGRLGQAYELLMRTEGLSISSEEATLLIDHWSKEALRARQANQ